MNMNTATATPIDITSTPRLSNNNSPRNATSNLTSQLQEASAAGFQIPYPQHDPQMGFGDTRPSELVRNDSISGMYGSYFGTNTKPISMRDRQRRESNTGSFMGGMSWGASSINGGDWVRDDVIMAGTSPSAFHQSSSFQSSSYLPKMEASFFRDYWCCNMVHASLHDLMQHMEEVHGQQSIDILNRSSISGPSGFSFPKQPNTPLNVPMKPSPQITQPNAPQVTRGFQANANPGKSVLATIQDDPLDSMDFDDAAAASMLPNLPVSNPQIPQQPFRQAMAGVLPNQPFSFLSSNPTVSSVNTPTLSTVTQSKTTPDSSIPTTPHAMNMAPFDISTLDMFNLADPNALTMIDSGFDFNNLNMALPNDLGGLTINDPAKQLSSKNGGLDVSQMQFAMNNGGFGLNNDIAQTIQQQQQMTLGVPGSGLGFPGHEEKKYKCPVIGCEKAYKNQNGLKYHKQHGHTNQKLKLNDDGSYSIVDPVTSVPYPGTIGMEKEKPYRCEKCGKRYKNLNGLKYHRQHSPPCNPELQGQAINGGVPGLITMQQLQNIP